MANGNAGGCLNHPSWRASPQYLLIIGLVVIITLSLLLTCNRYLVTAKKPTKVHILLEQAGQDTSKLPFIGVYVLKHQNTETAKPIFVLSPKDVVGNTEFMNDLQVSDAFPLSFLHKLMVY